MLRDIFKAGSVFSLALLLGSSFAAAQTVGRVNPTPLNIASSSDAYSRSSRPAPATSIDGGVVRASYLQSASNKPAPAATQRIASNQGANYGSTRPIPLSSLQPARSVPTYVPMSYTPTSYSPQQAPVYQTYGAPYVQRPSYMPGAANSAPTLTSYQGGNCGPGAPVYPIGGAAPVPYAAPQAAPGARPFMPLTSMPNQVYISRGLIGQPVVYVPGQPLRNGLRYILP